jgi:hypothetical protein
MELRTARQMRHSETKLDRWNEGLQRTDCKKRCLLRRHKMNIQMLRKRNQ